MKTDTAVKIIIVLLVVMILSVLGLLVIVNNENKPSMGPVSDETEGSTEVPATDKPIVKPPVTDAPVSGEPDTDSPETNSPETNSPDTDAPETQPPVSSDLPNGRVDISETLRTDTGTALNMIARLNAVTGEDGKITVSIEVSLEHYSMSVRARNGSLIIGERFVPFYVDELRISENVFAETVIYTFEDQFEYGETLDIFIEYPYSGKYAGVEIDELAITASVTLK